VFELELVSQELGLVSWHPVLGILSGDAELELEAPEAARISMGSVCELELEASEGAVVSIFASGVIGVAADAFVNLTIRARKLPSSSNVSTSMLKEMS
jgi:hypothetical protein